MALPETLEEFPIAPGRRGRLHALAALERAGLGAVARLPVSLRVVLEGVVRNRDGLKVTEEHVRALAGWRPQAPRTAEVPLVVARILLQDFTGVPLICDLAAMRSAAQRLGRDPAVVEPRVPMDLVIDHSVQIDAYGTDRALAENMRLEAQRNAERFAFIKWGERAFARLAVVPPGVGICHQVNLEHLARPLWEVGGVAFPDTVVGTDSHTTMINGLGVVGWGVGGIEAEAAMLGQPISFLLPDVVGVHLHGALPAGATATDLVLRLTELLRGARVVGKFVEYFGAGAATLSVPDRATIANMAPEYGATMGYFPVDGETLRYFAATGRPADGIAALRAWLTHQGMFGMPLPGALDYSAVVELDLASVAPSVAGPRRPQDRVPLPALKARFAELFAAPTAAGGYGKPPDQLAARYPAPPAAGPGVAAERGAPGELQSAAHRTASPVALTDAGVSGASTSESDQAGTVLRHEVEMVEAAHLPSPAAQPDAERPGLELGHGDVVIAAITSCTNTSNPGVMLAAGLLAQKAVARGLRVRTARQDLARAGVAGGDRLPGRDRPAGAARAPRLRGRRLRLHHLHRQLRAARAAHRGVHRGPRPGVRRGALRQPQLRGAHPPRDPRQPADEPAPGGRLRHRRADRHRPRPRTARQRRRRAAGVPARAVAGRGRARRAGAARAGPRGLPRALPGGGPGRRAVGRGPRRARRALPVGAVDLHRRAAVLRRTSRSSRRRRRRSAARARWRSSAIR